MILRGIRGRGAQVARDGGGAAVLDYTGAAVTDVAADGDIGDLEVMARQNHNLSLAERFAPAPPSLLDPTPVEAMAHRIKTPEGKRLSGLRKRTPEPVFGIIKPVLGFRQFLLRGWSPRPKRTFDVTRPVKNDAPRARDEHL